MSSTHLSGCLATATSTKCKIQAFTHARNHTSCEKIDQKLAKIFNFKTLFFYKTCDNDNVSQDGNLQQVLRKRF
jgi:hypothetical protein